MPGTLAHQDALAAAKQAVDAAGQVLLDRFRKPLKTTLKGPADPVTDADIAADAAILRILEQAGVPGNILSEESRTDRGDDELTWLVDPLCGTMPFLWGMVHWGSSIALRRGAHLELGALSVPYLGETLSALAGQGAWVNEDRLTSSAPGGELGDAVIGLGLLPETLVDADLRWLAGVGRCVTFSSGVYPLAQVCLGRLAGLVIHQLGSLVHLSGRAAVAGEAGVIVTDARGDAIDWQQADRSLVVVAAWPKFHEQLIRSMGG